MKKISLILIIGILVFAGCYKYQFNYQKTTRLNRYFNLKDTVSIHVSQTLIEQAEGFSITFDSVKNDSRCPTGAECFWAGMASAVFHYTKNANSDYFTLYTLPTFGNDTTIDHYDIRLINLSPYPSVSKQIKPGEYISKILVKKID